MSRIPLVLALLLTGAHFLRVSGPGEALCWVALAGVSVVDPSRIPWMRPVLTAALALALVTWLETARVLVNMRMALGAPWLRLALIMAACVGLVGWAAVSLWTGRLGRRMEEGRDGHAVWPPVLAFLLAFGGYAAIQLNVSRPFLLGERFLPGLGWVQGLALALVGAEMAWRMRDPAKTPAIRRRFWGLFSFVFFAQLGLGLLSFLPETGLVGQGWRGMSIFLLNPVPHLPIPALVAAGPIFRGEGFFMLGLFAATLALVGPAWCSHLCYVGAWDMTLAGKTKKPAPLPKRLKTARLGLAALVFASAWALRLAGVSGWTAFWLAAGFGVAGLAVMLLASRRQGVMVHCAAFCPLGVLSNLFGRLSPFRITLETSCTRCGSCSRTCRYDALRPEDLAAGRPGLSCSLCGDCLPACPTSRNSRNVFEGEREIGYRFLGRTSISAFGVRVGARDLFVGLVAGLYALFLGTARM